MKTASTLFLTFLVSTLLMSTAKPPKEVRSMFKELGGGFAYVSGGYTLLERDSVSVQPFFMSKGEITNGEYHIFLDYLKVNNETEKLKVAMIDSAKWSSGLKHKHPYEELYSWHPAYAKYPVVNVSYEAAQLYCEYLTKVYNDKAAKSNSGITYKFRIPERAEFLRAAKGDNLNRIYAWNGPYMRNQSGAIQCNHVQIGNEDVHYNSETQKYEIVDSWEQTEVSGTSDYPADVTAPSISYWPNQFGIYNLNGNVSEMIAEKGKAVGGDWQSPGFDVRNESIKTIEGPAPTTGFRVVMTIQ